MNQTNKRETYLGDFRAWTRRVSHMFDVRKGNGRLFFNKCLTEYDYSMALARYCSVVPNSLSVIKQQQFVEPEQFKFEDNGAFPNSVLPLLVYREALHADGQDPASVFEERFAENDWCNSWRNGVYPFVHYHSTTHEILGVYCGAATLRLGGEHGRTLEIRSGDVIVIPAGVAHQKLEDTADFAVVGAYPHGREWDLLRGLPGERPKADYRIAALPIPDNDPIYGAEGPLRQIWKHK